MEVKKAMLRICGSEEARWEGDLKQISARSRDIRVYKWRR